MRYAVEMRIALTIDDAVSKALNDLAHRTHKPFKQVVNETLRTGLSATGARQSKRHKVKPAALGAPCCLVLTWDKALALADAIENQGSGISSEN